MILFRADGNNQIGSGHIMRCLSIADAFLRNNEESIFVLADDTMKKFVEKRGFNTVVLGTQYTNMEDELPLIREHISSIEPRIVVVDSYYATDTYFKALKAYAKLAYIDDYEYKPYSVEYLINYNIYGEAFEYTGIYSKAGVACPDLITGLRYAALRDQFRNVPRHVTSEKVSKVLFSTGGTDQYHLAKRLIEKLGSKCSDGTEYHFLVGSLNRDLEYLRELVSDKKNCTLHYNVSDMRTLISGCDIVVSAAGSTLYEVSACGVPLITYVIADNQERGAAAFERTGLALSCGRIIDLNDPVEPIIKRLQILDDSYQMRKEISVRMQDLVDGYGADRIAERLS